MVHILLRWSADGLHIDQVSGCEKSSQGDNNLLDLMGDQPTLLIPNSDISQYERV